MQKIENLNLQELLENAESQLNIKVLALSLARSRQEMPTPRSVQLTAHLIASQGDKWLQVLIRQGVIDYEMVFVHCINYYHTYPALIQITSPQKNKELAILQDKVLELIECRKLSLQVQWNLFACFVKKYNGDDLLHQSSQLLNKVEKMMNTNSFFKGDMQLLYEMQLNQSQSIVEQKFESSFSTVFDLHYTLLKLFIKVKKICLNNMNYLDFVSNHSSFIEWTRTSFINVMMFLDQVKNKKMQRNSIIERLYSSAIYCLIELAEINEIADVAQKYCQDLVNFLVMQPLMANKSVIDRDQIIQVLNFQYGLIMNQYGDDHSSLLAKTIVKNARNMPLFLRVYLSTIGEPSILKFIKEDEMFLKLAIVHQQIKQREDLILSVEPFLERIFRDIDSNLPTTIDSQGNYCRKLRLLYLYSSILKQQFFSSLLEKCLFMLKQASGKSYLFSQACFIFQEILKSYLDGGPNCVILPRISKMLKQNVHQLCLRFMDIVESIYNRKDNVDKDEKMLKIFGLLHKLIYNNQDQARRVNTKLMESLSKWLLLEIDSAWQQGRKTTPAINELINTIKIAVILIDESYYIDVSQSIYNILSLLTNSQNLEIEQELLQILTFVLDMQHQISYQISIVLISLGGLAHRYRGNLHPILGVIKAFCDRKLVNSVLYNWTDLITFFLNLFIQFFTSFVTANYMELYDREWSEQVYTFERFIEAYEEYFKENRQSRLNALQCINAMPSNQYQVRLFLILNHQQPIEGFNFYSLLKVQSYHYRSTMKLIYLMYVDSLMRGYSQQLINQFLQFHILFREKTERRDLKIEQFGASPYNELSINIYVLQGFKRLLAQSKIDMMDFNSLTQEFHLNQ